MAKQARSGSAATRSDQGRRRQAPADRLLGLLGDGPAKIGRVGARGLVSVAPAAGGRFRFASEIVKLLIREDLARRMGASGLEITPAGAARLKRLAAGDHDPFLAQHADLREETIADERGARRVVVNDGESTLVWLHRRRGPDGLPLISAIQLAAGERLRADLTRAQIMPRVTANWSSAVASGRGDAGAAEATDVMIAARQRIDRAFAEVGQDFAGLLIDVCGFLKGLSDVERERGWPARSAKLVLDMALTRLARHYGLAEEARGPDRGAGLRFWGAADYRPSTDGASA